LQYYQCIEPLFVLSLPPGTPFYPSWRRPSRTGVLFMSSFSLNLADIAEHVRAHLEASGLLSSPVPTASMPTGGFPPVAASSFLYSAPDSVLSPCTAGKSTSSWVICIFLVQEIPRMHAIP
jgi:hypothetical protein